MHLNYKQNKYVLNNEIKFFAYNFFQHYVNRFLMICCVVSSTTLIVLFYPQFLTQYTFLTTNYTKVQKTMLKGFLNDIIFRNNKVCIQPLLRNLVSSFALKNRQACNSFLNTCLKLLRLNLRI